MMRWNRVAIAFAAVAGFAFASTALAVEPYQEYNKKVESSQNLTALTDELMGDSVSLYNGATEFSATDISVPGNNALPVQLSRHFSVSLYPSSAGSSAGYPNYGGAGNWDIDVPYIATTWAQGSWPDARCSAPTAPVPAAPLTSLDVWHGNSVHIPGAGDRKLLRLLTASIPQPTDGIARPWTTRERDMVRCIPMQAGQTLGGEGFLLQTRDGLKYYFDAVTTRYAGFIMYQPGPGGPPIQAARVQYYLLATKVEDRFGNTVNYHYNSDGLPDSITSNDGRSITLQYTNGRLTSADAGDRHWSYDYGTTGDAAGMLIAAAQQGGSSWGYSYTGSLFPSQATWDGGSNATCSVQPPPDTAAFQLVISHPSGAKGTFDFSNRRHPRQGVHANACSRLLSGGQYTYKLVIPTFFDVMSLWQKKIEGPALAPRTWTYSYPTGKGALWGTYGNGQPYPCTTCPSEKTVVVDQPDGTKKQYRYGDLYAANEGRLLGTTTLDSSGVVVRTESTDYMSESEVVGQNFHPVYGLGFGDDEPSTLAVRPITRRVIQQDGEQYTSAVDKGCSGAALYCFDAYAQPLSSTKASTAGFSRNEQTEYVNDTAQWILGQVSKSTVDGVVASQTQFDTLVRPEKVWAFGQLKQTLTYYPSNGPDATQRGTISSVSDGRDSATFDTTIQLANWKRGIPQTILHPATPDQPSGASESAAVDDNGQIVAVLDEDGARTCYAYNAMGLITQITYPSETAANTCDTSRWAPTTATFAPVSSAEYGLDVGHWKRTLSTGNARQVTYFDGMWRPVVEEAFDATNGTTTANTRSLTVKRYDSAGRLAFQSYSLRTLSDFASTALTGTKTQYDAIGRPRFSVQDSEYGPLTTTTTYVPFNGTTHAYVRVTDPKANVTNTWFQTFDQPSTDAPVVMQLPEGANVDISRDAFGKARSIRRRNAANTVGLTRSYVYDDAQQLCKTVEPETGATIQTYDAAGNVVWSASGQALASTSTCNTADVAGSQKVVRSYDQRGRVRSVSFPDGLGNTSYTYSASGKVTNLTVSNGAAGSVLSDYGYLRRGMLASERLRVDSQDWTQLYGYSANGHLATLVYPDNLFVDFAPNALGQPTRAGSYATGVAYYPNGGMSGFTYGNGLVHTMSQNARQLPERSLDSGGALDDTYLYDANGNVDSITDGLPGNRGNRTMQYDGLNRLTAVTSPMFSGGAVYQYDVLDNLTRVKAPGRDHSYVYDVNWRLQTVNNTTTGTSAFGLTYDPRGNLSSKANQSFVFDTGNRLRSAMGLETYSYDGQGRRVRAVHVTQGAIYSFYDQGGVLRFQRDERQGKTTDYINLNGSLVAQVSNTFAPPMPTPSVPGSSSDGNYTVSWQPVTGAIRYELEERFNSGAWTSVYSGAGTSYAASGRSSGTYDYHLRACNASQCSGWSTTATELVLLKPSVPPTIDNAPSTALNGNYIITWTASPGATSYTLQESINGGAWAPTSTATRAATFNNKPAGSYQYKVNGCNPSGCSGDSNVVTVQSIQPPSGVPVIDVPASSANGSYTATWTSVAGAATYTLEEQANGGAWSPFAANAGTSAAISGRATGTYTYRVSACNPAGCGQPSASKSISVLLPPAAGPSLTVPASDYSGTYTVSWSSVATTTSYQLEESANGGAWALQWADGATSAVVSNRATGTYSYRARACNSSGCSGYGPTGSITVTRVPTTPTITSAIKKQWKVGTRTEIQCSAAWTAVAGATTYELMAPSGSLLYSGPDTSVSGVRSSSTYCSDTKIIRACNVAGCSEWSSPPTTQIVQNMSGGGGGGVQP